jgi:hypothetical protein
MIMSYSRCPAPPPTREDAIAMDVTLHIPDEFAQRLKAAGGDLSRRAL